MRLKYLITLFIFSFMFIKPTFAVVKKHEHISAKQKNIKKSKKIHKKRNTSSVKKDYMHGTASYYGVGDGFNGRKMANGETFDTNNQFVAAHPTLPLGTKLKVINEHNGKVAYVEIKDRMPRGRRVIDLSYGAAGKLGMRHRGISSVTLVKIDNAEFYKQKHQILAQSENTQG